jgi:hypothetical protein
MAHPGGRPTKLDDQLLTTAWEYLGVNRSDPKDNLLPLWKLHENAVVPTVEGLCLSLHISRDTAYNWEKDNPEFSDIMSLLKHLQGLYLINGSLGNKFNPTISKLILSSKHGYVEKSEQDITSKGEAIAQPVSKDTVEAFIAAVKNDTKQK